RDPRAMRRLRNSNCALHRRRSTHLALQLLALARLRDALGRVAQALVVAGAALSCRDRALSEWLALRAPRRAAPGDRPRDRRCVRCALRRAPRAPSQRRGQTRTIAVEA